MENRIYPDNSIINLYEEKDARKQHPKKFYLKSCIGTGASCIAYQAEDENGIPVKLKQFRPVGMKRENTDYRLIEERFIQAYRQQISMLKNDKTAAITASLYGLYRDDSGYWWTSVTAMVGRTLEKIFLENSLRKNVIILHWIAESIKAYHEAGWLLLDVKPQNILVIDSLGMQGINFFDFDSFIHISELERAICEGQMLLLSSSESFSAPELLEKNVDLKEIGITADFYSVGAMLFQAVFLRRAELFDCLPGTVYDFAASEDSGREMLTVEEKAVISDILKHTLTISPVSRYETDEELIEVLKKLRKLLERDSPRLTRFLPNAVGSFVGRRKEINTVANALRSSRAPIYLCGLGGIGKTQLALKVAETLQEEFDFCYTTFKGSIRETILSLPMENLSVGWKDESGVPDRISDEDLYQVIFSSLRDRSHEKTVLILDNFDAQKDEDTPSLRYDPDLADLESLPIRILITTRCRFEDVCTIQIDSLEEKAILALLSDALPEEQEDTLLQLADSVGRHTLTLSLLAGSIRESRGKLDAKKLIAQFTASSEPSNVFTQLKMVFRATDMSRVARSVMSCACLFPTRGISSELLLRLFSEEQWLMANQLERSGWLRFDGYSCLWSLHPVVKAVCMAEKSTQINWGNTGSFITALRKAQKTGVFEDAGPESLAQITELFANIGKYNLHKPFPWKQTCTVFFLLAAITAGVLFYLHRQTDQSPIIYLQLFQDGAEEGNSAQDREIILNRLRQLGIRNVSLDKDSERITASAHTSLFGAVSDLDSSVPLFLTQPGKLFGIGRRGMQAAWEEIDRAQIISVKAEVGIPAGVGREERAAARLPVNGEFPYLTISLDETAGRIIKTLKDESETLYFAFDYDHFSDDNVVFLAVPGEIENSYCLLNGSWLAKQPYRVLAFTLTHTPLTVSYQAQWYLDPAAAWEEPNRLSRDAVGEMQCSIGDLTGDTVTFSFRASSPNSISDYTLEEVKATFKRRLDQVGSPYAIGIDHMENRTITVCMPTEKLGYDVLRALCSSSVNLSAAKRHNDPIHIGSANDFSPDIIRKGDGTFALQLTPKDTFSFSTEKLKTELKRMLAEDDHVIELTCGSRIVLASAEIDNAVEDGVLIFEHLPFLNNERIGEENVFLLKLLNEIIRNRTLADASAYYKLDEDTIVFSNPEDQFGIQRSITGTVALIEKINQDFNPVKAGYLDSDDSNMVYVMAHQEFGPEFCRDSAKLVKDMYISCDFEESGVDTFLFFLGEEEADERYRLTIDKLEAGIWKIEKPYAIKVIMNGEGMQQYSNVWEDIFQNDEFYSERHAYVWNLRGQ